MQKPAAILSVTNDLVTDQRVDKVARSLQKMGFDVLLVGRRKSDSHAMDPRPYPTHRFLLLAEKGPLFYAEFNTRLFFFLLQHRARVLVANDLDTLLANYLASRILKTELVYDSHEYFTGVPELTNRKWVQGFWKRIEKHIFPRLKWVFTVNESIASLYAREYGMKPRVVRNLPERVPYSPPDRHSLGLPDNQYIIILQGAGINIDRGAEEAVEAMAFLDNTLLLIVGDGDVIPKLKMMVEAGSLGQKVRFIPKLPYDQLSAYTRCADLGLTLDKDTNLNYRLSLPNKLFDYIHARIPILASPLPEIAGIIRAYNIGMLIQNHQPGHIAEMIRQMLVDKNQVEKWKENLKLAASELHWEVEERCLADVYKPFL